MIYGSYHFLPSFMIGTIDENGSNQAQLPDRHLCSAPSHSAPQSSEHFIRLLSQSIKPPTSPTASSTLVLHSEMSRYQLTLAFSSFILIQCSVALIDFTKCRNKLPSLELRCPSSAVAFCPNGSFPPNFNSSRPALTPSGCYQTCGRSFQFVPTKEIVGMVAVWLIPYITLCRSFCFPGLGKLNSAKTVILIISNPIGSMWSMLLRQESFRRIERAAVEAELNDSHLPNPRDIATVAAAIEEMTWKNRVGEIVNELRGIKLLNNRNSPLSDSDSVEHGSKTSCSVPQSDDTAHLETSKPSKHVHTSLKELFSDARQELVLHRTESQAGTWIAVITLIGSIAIAFVKNVTSEQRKYLPRTIAIVYLGLHFVTLVQLSGNIGAFAKGYAALRSIRRLQRNIENLWVFDQSTKDKLFKLSRTILYEDEGKTHIDDLLEMNAVWRPDKSITLGDKHAHTGLSLKEETGKALLGSLTDPEESADNGHQYRGHGPHDSHISTHRKPKFDWTPVLAFLCAFTTVSISYGGSLYVSYKAARREGFGCQCVLWTCIYGLWLINALIDWSIHLRSQRIRRNTVNLERLWKRYVTWNSFVAASILIALTAHLCGLSNFCACNSGSLWPGRNHYVNLYPPTDTQWRKDWTQGGGAFALGLVLNCLIIVILTYGRSMKSSCLWTLEEAEARKLDEDLYPRRRSKHHDR